MSWRSLFFTPANRPDLMKKLSKVTADNFAIDLEDGTPLGAKEEARRTLIDNIRMIRGDALSGRLLVRINAIGTGLERADLKAVLAADVDGVILPKLERHSDLDWLEDEISAAGRDDRFVIVGGIETIAGVLDIRAFTSAPRSMLRALYFGPEDIAAEAGLARTADSDEVLYARQKVALAAKAAGLFAFDQAVLGVHDDDAFGRDCRKARDWGYDGKICLNPKQALAAATAFMPSPEQIDHARRMLQAYAESTARGAGTLMFDGAMIDVPMVERARRILERAGIAV